MLVGTGSESFSRAQRVIEESLEAGIGRFDTASAYGRGASEEALGRLIGGRSGIQICTKVAGPDARRDARSTLTAIVSQIDASLSRMHVDCLDRCLLHRIDDDTALEPALGALADAQLAGKVNIVGTSSMSGDLLLRARLIAADLGLDLAVEQCKLSLLDRSAESSILPVIRRERMTVMLYGVLDEGLLARSDSSGEDRPGRPAAGIRLQPWPDAAARSLTARQAVAREMATVARDAGLSLLELAIGFAMRSASSLRGSVVVGATRPGQPSSLAAATATCLDDAVIARIDEIVVPGTSVGIPDRSLMRRSLIEHSSRAGSPLFVGDGRAKSDQE